MVLFLAFLAASAGAAQAQPAPLSIRDAVNLVLSRSPEVLNSRERIVEADRRESFAIAQLFPTLNATASTAIEKNSALNNRAPFGGEPYNQYSAQLRLNQLVYVGGALGAARGVAKKETQIRERDLQIVQRDQVVLVIQAFYAVLANQQLLDILHQTSKVLERSLATANQYLKIGRGQLIDVLQIKTQLALLSPRISTAENQVRAYASQLATLLHETQGGALNLTGSFSHLDPKAIMPLIGTREELPELQKSELEISQFQERAAVELAPHFPRLELQGVYGRAANAKTDLLTEYSTAWSFGLYLTVPLFSGLSSHHQRGILRSQERQLHFGREKLLDVVYYNRVQAERDLNVAASVLDSSRKAAEYAQTSLKEAQRDFGLQTIKYQQFLTSQQNHLEAESSYLQAKYGYINALSRFFVASGIPIGKLVDALAGPT